MVKKQKSIFRYERVNYLSLAFIIIIGILCLVNIGRGASAEIEESLVDNEALELTKQDEIIEEPEESEEKETIIIEDQIPAKIIGDEKPSHKNSDGLDFSTKSLIVETNNYDSIKIYPNVKNVFSNIYKISFDSIEATSAAYDSLSSNSDIINVRPDIELKQFSLGKQTEIKPYSIVSEDDGYSWGTSDIGADLYTAWHYLAGNDKNNIVRVAVLDSGVFQGHVFFEGDRIATSSHTRNYVDGTSGFDDDNGHGTEVASIIAQSTPENVKIYPSKVLDRDGHTTNFSSILEAAYNAAAYDKASIINLSLGASNYTCTEADRSNLQRIIDAGAMIIAASGNEGQNSVSFPANCSNVIAVGSTDRSRQHSSFSNYGPEIDFAMPGSEMRVAHNSNTTAIALAEGTSLSAPFLTAAAALIKTEHPNYNQSQLLSALEQYTVNLGNAQLFGKGIVDFGTKMFGTPRIQATPSAKDWMLTDNVSVFGVCKEKIVAEAVTVGNNNPVWEDVNNINYFSRTTWTDFKTNNTYKFWYKTETGKTGYSTAEIKYIDRLSPNIASEPKVYSSDAPTTIGVDVLDSQSGLASAKLYYRKKEPNSNYTVKTNSYNNINTQTSAKFTLTDLEDDTDYSAYITVSDKLGNKSQTDTFTFKAMAASQNPSSDPDDGQQNNQQGDIDNQQANTAIITGITPEAVKTSATSVNSPKTEDNLPTSVSVFAISSVIITTGYHFIAGRRR